MGQSLKGNSHRTETNRPQGEDRTRGTDMNANLSTMIATVSRHLICGLAALVAGGIALSVAAGPVAAKSSLPDNAPVAGKVIFVL